MIKKQSIFASLFATITVILAVGCITDSASAGRHIWKVPGTKGMTVKQLALNPWNPDSLFIVLDHRRDVRKNNPNIPRGEQVIALHMVKASRTSSNMTPKFTKVTENLNEIMSVDYTNRLLHAIPKLDAALQSLKAGVPPQVVIKELDDSNVLRERPEVQYGMFNSHKAVEPGLANYLYDLGRSYQHKIDCFDFWWVDEEKRDRRASSNVINIDRITVNRDGNVIVAPLDWPIDGSGLPEGVCRFRKIDVKNNRLVENTLGFGLGLSTGQSQVVATLDPNKVVFLLKDDDRGFILRDGLFPRKNDHNMIPDSDSEHEDENEGDENHGGDIAGDDYPQYLTLSYRVGGGGDYPFEVGDGDWRPSLTPIFGVNSHLDGFTAANNGGILAGGSDILQFKREVTYGKPELSVVRDNPVFTVPGTGEISDAEISRFRRAAKKDKSRVVDEYSVRSIAGKFFRDNQDLKGQARFYWPGETADGTVIAGVASPNLNDTACLPYQFVSFGPNCGYSDIRFSLPGSMTESIQSPIRLNPEWGMAVTPEGGIFVANDNQKEIDFIGPDDRYEEFLNNKVSEAVHLAFLGEGEKAVALLSSFEPENRDSTAASLRIVLGLKPNDGDTRFKNLIPIFDPQTELDKSSSSSGAPKRVRSTYSFGVLNLDMTERIFDAIDKNGGQQDGPLNSLRALMALDEATVRVDSVLSNGFTPEYFGIRRDELVKNNKTANEVPINFQTTTAENVEDKSQEPSASIPEQSSRNVKRVRNTVDEPIDNTTNVLIGDDEGSLNSGRANAIDSDQRESIGDDERPAKRQRISNDETEQNRSHLVTGQQDPQFQFADPEQLHVVLTDSLQNSDQGPEESHSASGERFREDEVDNQNQSSETAFPLFPLQKDLDENQMDLTD